ncbi:unnamed protein product [Triticum turgidum subsp. durum]|uniref:Uncharacterized protein n=1 Tax=Triticum turgidum subsp. durum TaxID=4567 RepID=A0A9R0Y5K6_TRITD|nr:unnamed protein product [Triticum turgidum subsp. durum]
MGSSPTSYKKATAALDEAARARLRGPFFGGTTPSSASGQEDVDDDDGLVELVHEFYNGYGEDAVAKEAVAPRPASATWVDALQAALRAVVGAGPNVAGGEAVRKLVAARLRARGFDAGVCRSSWERGSSVPAGSHEYVDVVIAAGASTSRYIVEVNLAIEFETARPSAEYQELLLALPTVLVARPETFKEVAAAMCAAAAESIRGAGMHVPPWRRARYVQAKWSGKYKRAAAVAVAAAAPSGSPWEAVASSTAAAEARPRRGVPASGGPKHCGMEMGRREMAFGSTRPLMFRGL